jgi:hypothetical protein
VAIIHQIRSDSLHGRRLLSNVGAPPTERAMVKTAMEKVASCCARAQLWLTANKSADSKTKALVRKWFGNDGSDICTRLSARYRDMVNVYSRNVHVWRFTGTIGDILVPVPDQEDAGFYAQVIPELGTQFSNKSVDIEFADAFFEVQDLARQQKTRLSDAKVRTGTIIHETSHRVWVVQGTGVNAMLSDDFAYDYLKCRRLAKHKAHYARANADNIMYFALEFYDTRYPTVPDNQLQLCRYRRNPTSVGLPAGDMLEKNGGDPVHVNKLSGD